MKKFFHFHFPFIFYHTSHPVPAPSLAPSGSGSATAAAAVAAGFWTAPSQAAVGDEQWKEAFGEAAEITDVFRGADEDEGDGGFEWAGTF